MPLFRFFNQGEITALADGRRSVVALAPGRKWITLVDWTTLETARVSMDLWRHMKPEPLAGYSARRVRAAMKARLRYVEATQAIREAIKSV